MKSHNLLTLLLMCTQAVPDEEPLSYIAFPSPGATPTLGHCGVLPEAVHRDPLLHFLLP